MLTLGRVVLAAIFVLPPGTFRTVDKLVDIWSAATFTEQIGERDALPRFNQAQQTVRPASPSRLRVRHWELFAFTVKSQHAGNFACHADRSTMSASDVPSPCPETVPFARAASILTAHRTPRDLIIALCELLH